MNISRDPEINVIVTVFGKVESAAGVKVSNHVDILEAEISSIDDMILTNIIDIGSDTTVLIEDF